MNRKKEGERMSTFTFVKTSGNLFILVRCIQSKVAENYFRCI